MAEDKRYLDPKTRVAYYDTEEEKEWALARLKEKGCTRIEETQAWRLNEQELVKCLIGYIEDDGP